MSWHVRKNRGFWRLEGCRESGSAKTPRSAGRCSAACPSRRGRYRPSSPPERGHSICLKSVIDRRVRWSYDVDDRCRAAGRILLLQLAEHIAREEIVGCPSALERVRNDRKHAPGRRSLQSIGTNRKTRCSRESPLRFICC